MLLCSSCYLTLLSIFVWSLLTNIALVHRVCLLGSATKPLGASPGTIYLSYCTKYSHFPMLQSKYCNPLKLSNCWAFQSNIYEGKVFTSWLYGRENEQWLHCTMRICLKQHSNASPARQILLRLLMNHWSRCIRTNESTPCISIWTPQPPPCSEDSTGNPALSRSQSYAIYRKEGVPKLSFLW